MPLSLAHPGWSLGRCCQSSPAPFTKTWSQLPYAGDPTVDWVLVSTFSRSDALPFLWHHAPEILTQGTARAAPRNEAFFPPPPLPLPGASSPSIAREVLQQAQDSAGTDWCPGFPSLSWSKLRWPWVCVHACVSVCTCVHVLCPSGSRTTQGLYLLLPGAPPSSLGTWLKAFPGCQSYCFPQRLPRGGALEYLGRS